MRVVVTGAAGFIGGETCLRLLDAGHEVLGIDSRRAPKWLRQNAVRIEQCNFASPRCQTLIYQFDPQCLIHCAGTSLVGPSISNPDIYYHNNFVHTKQLLDNIRGRDLRVIFSSSASVYGQPQKSPCREQDPVAPISPYGESKAMIEWMLNSYHKAYGVESVSFRYFNACGADSQARHGQEPGATHIIARVLESIRYDRPFDLYGNDYDTPDGTCVRDYVHVQDIADAHVRATDREIKPGIYNLGSGSGISNLEIMEAAERITKKTLQVNTQPRRAGDPPELIADWSNWSNISGWKPQFDLDQILDHAWRWYQR